MPTPIPFVDDGGTRAFQANQATWRTPPTARVSIWWFLLASAAAPFLFALMAAGAWLAWMCLRGVMGTPGAVIALAGIAAMAVLIRRHTGLEVGLALCLISAVGLIVVAWVVLALVALAVVAGV
jgi:hypothetical protein